MVHFATRAISLDVCFFVLLGYIIPLRIYRRFVTRNGTLTHTGSRRLP